MSSEPLKNRCLEASNRGFPAGSRITKLLRVIAVAASLMTASAAGSALAVDANDVFNRLPGLVDADPGLEGAWIDVDRDDDAGPGRVVFRRVFDSAKADAQTAAIDRLITGLVPTGHFRIDATRDLRLPVSELKAEMARRIAGDQVRFDGCRLLTMRVRRNPADGRIVVVPRFRIVRPGQLPALVAECNKLMDRNPSWRAAGVAAVDTAPDQADLVAEPATPEPNAVFRQALEAIRRVPALRGSWLTVDSDDQGHPGVAATQIIFRRGFDAGRMPEQAAAMEALFRRLVPNGHYRIDTARDAQLPLSSLLAALRRIIDMEPEFAGCSIDSAFYLAPAPAAAPQFDLVLQGRVWRKSQVEAIHDLCARLMAEDPAWQSARVGVSSDCAKTLIERKPDADLAATCYGDAIQRFWARDYAEADRLLALASLDAPANITYRYWRVLAGLASGNEAEAEERLRRTIHGFDVRQRSTEYVEMLRSIYRVQGPLRFSLMAAESRAMISPRMERPAAIASPIQ
jgi:hypothetical protein